MGDQERGRPLSRLVRQAHAGNYRLRNQMRIFLTGEVDEPSAVVHCPSEIRGGTQGEPGFTNAARSDQSEEAGIGECGLHLGQQPTPTDETGRLGRKFANAGSIGGGHAVSLGWVLGALRRTQFETYCFEDAIQLAI